MPQQLFLSHDSRDHERATTIATLIVKVTLGQIAVWHSSDGSPSGGLRPGQVWLDEIRARLAASKAVVALLTPTSVVRPWLLFESGFGAAQADCDVIPVCVGVDSLSEVPYPLAMYQAYQLSDYESLKRFLEKIAAKYEVLFDEKMARPYLRAAVKQLAQFKGASLKAPTQPTLLEAISAINEHLDKRLVGLLSRTESIRTEGEPLRRYNISVDLKLRRKGAFTQFVEIADGMSVQDVFDRVYYMLEGEVEAYTYLEQWLLRDKDTRERLIIREIQRRVSATAIFAAGTKWEVVRLSVPYSATKGGQFRSDA